MNCKNSETDAEIRESVVKNTPFGLENEAKNKKEYKLRMVGGLDFHEVSVAFRKELKNGKVYEAGFWAFVLLESGYHKHIWKHLAIYASQLDGNKVVEVSALRTSFDLNTTVKNRKTEEGFCYICRAIIDLCGTKDNTAKIMKQIIDDYCCKNWLELI